MSRNPAHKWLLIIQPEAKQQFDRLTRSSRRATFRHLRDLLNADDPYALPFVEMIQSKIFERQRKFRVGDYRIIFAIESEEVIDQKHQYKGTLFVLDVLHRKEAYKP
jgi:mRNA-degrading endonuclease RelE of RelBE toxin-antitoxin system